MMTLHSGLLETCARRYGVTAAQLSPISGGNYADVFQFQRDGQEIILKINPPHPDMSFELMQSVLEWLAYLTAHGGQALRPVCSAAGRLIEPLELDGAPYVLMAFEKAPGVLAEGIQPEDWSAEMIQALGRALGLVHRIAQDYAPADPALRRPEWDQGDSCFNPMDLFPQAEKLILEKRAALMTRIEKLPKDRESYGLAHLDLHFGNFFVDLENRRITLLDFDDCAYGWYVMDIAMLLFDVLVVYAGSDPQRFGAFFLRNLLQGYRREKPLSPFWLEQLPDLLKLLEIGVYLDVAQDYSEQTAGEWGRKFMPGRRERILQELPYVELDFRSF